MLRSVWVVVAIATTATSMHHLPSTIIIVDIVVCIVPNNRAKQKKQWAANANVGSNSEEKLAE